MFLNSDFRGCEFVTCMIYNIKGIITDRKLHVLHKRFLIKHTH